MSESNFESELKEYYEAKRRSYLTSRIGTAAEFMRETLLLCAVYDELFEDSISPEREVRREVETLRDHVQNGEYEDIEDKLPEVLSGLESERDEARSALQRELHDIADRLSGFEALNKRIEEIDDERINSLFETVQHLDEVPADKETDYEEVENQVRAKARRFLNELEDIEEALFEGFRGSDIENVVRSLIQGDVLHLDELPHEDLTALQESQLGSYVHLTLGSE